MSAARQLFSQLAELTGYLELLAASQLFPSYNCRLTEPQLEYGYNWIADVTGFQLITGGCSADPVITG